MLAQLVGVDELGGNHNLCALHAGDADHLRMVDVHIHAQKDTAQRGCNRLDFVILGKLGLIVQVAVGRTLDAQNLPLGGKQAQVQDVVHNKAAGYQIDLILDGIFPAGVEVIRGIPLGDIGFDIGEDYQVGQGFDLSKRSRDADYGTSHMGHLFIFLIE